MRTKSLIINTLLISTLQILAQNVGIGTTSPHPSALLHITASDKGILLPNVGLSSLTNTAPITSPPAMGLLIFNDGSGGVTPRGFYWWDGSKWRYLIDSVSVKGLLTGDGSPSNPIGLQPGTNSGDIIMWNGSQWTIVSSPFDSVCNGALANYVQKWTGTELCNSVIYDDGNMVGVRTASPSAYFDISPPAGVITSDTPLFKIDAPGTPMVTVFGLGNRKIGIGTDSPEELVHITYGHGGSWPYFRSTLIGVLGGTYEGEYIGFNAKILPDTAVFFIKLGGGSNGAGEQYGGSAIVTDIYGNMHFQTYMATAPGKDTMPDTTLFQPQITFTYNGDIITRKRGETVTGVKWVPLPKTLLGTLPLNTITTVSYNLPASVPPDAVEVLVYLYARTGDLNPDADLELRVYTREGTTEYSKYFFIHGYTQNAWSYNSDNFWLPVTSDRKIYVQSIGTAMTGNRWGEIFIIGYR